MIKKPCCSRFSLHKFVQLKFFGPNSKTCSNKVRAAWGRVSRGLTVQPFKSLYLLIFVSLQISLWKRSYWLFFKKYTQHFLISLIFESICRSMKVKSRIFISTNFWAKIKSTPSWQLFSKIHHRGHARPKCQACTRHLSCQ